MAPSAPLPVRPRGEVHPLDRCAFCGQDGLKGGMREVTIRATMAKGWLCDDATACARRRDDQRQLALFGEHLGG